MIAARSPWLEPHDLFEGVGAHELNPRFSNVDNADGWDEALANLANLANLTVVTARTPALFAARAANLIAVAPIRLDGIDIAHYQYDQGPVNWHTVAAIPTFWAATKITQSTHYLDPTAVRSRREMADAALRLRGLYHWLSSTTDPHQQAVWFLTCIGALQQGEFAMLDAEEAGITVDKVVAWCEAVEAFTRRPCAIYTGAYVAGGSIWTDPRVRTSRYGARPMIIAAYTTEAKMLALPGLAAHRPNAWQYSSNGPVAGIVGRCDMDHVYDTSVFDLAAGITHDEHPAEPGQPTPIPAPPAPTPITPALAAATQGDTMQLQIIALEDPSNRGTALGKERYSWNGLVKRLLRNEGDYDRLVFMEMVNPSTTLARPIVMGQAEFDSYQTV